jgi:amino acid transporter
MAKKSNNGKFSLRPKWLGRKRDDDGRIEKGEIGYISPEERKRLRKMGRGVLIAVITTFITAIAMAFVMGYLITTEREIVYWMGKPVDIQTLLNTMVPFLIAIIVSLLSSGSILWFYTKSYLDKD